MFPPRAPRNCDTFGSNFCVLAPCSKNFCLPQAASKVQNRTGEGKPGPRTGKQRSLGAELPVTMGIVALVMAPPAGRARVRGPSVPSAEALPSRRPPLLPPPGPKELCLHSVRLFHSGVFPARPLWAFGVGILGKRNSNLEF